MLAAERRCTRVLHGWLANAFELERVADPRQVLSLDVDGVLEETTEGYSAAGVPGIAALRLLQLGGVAVLLNTARGLTDVVERCQEFRLLGGVAELGGAIWDGVFTRALRLLSDRGGEQLDRLRTILRSDPSVVLDSAQVHSIRASRLLDVDPAPIAGADARRLLDQNGLNELGFLVAPTHTDFFDRAVDKGTGIRRLQQELRVQALPLSAIGDALCDVPMMRQAAFVFLPAATLPAYIAPRRQQVVRSRNLGDQALWEAACRIVPNIGLQGRVLAAIRQLDVPEWFPAGRRRSPLRLGLLPRLAATLSSIP